MHQQFLSEQQISLTIPSAILKSDSYVDLLEPISDLCNRSLFAFLSNSV